MLRAKIAPTFRFITQQGVFKMNNYFIRFAILLVSLVLTQTAFADVKIKSRQTMSGQSYENTIYIKGKRQRTEQNTGGMQMINLTQCDLKRSVQIMPATQVYTVNLWETAPSVAPTTKTAQTQSKIEKGGVITTTYTTKDTGERKQMFGYTARHLIITMESEPTPDACNTQKTKMQFDGWYIDAAFALNCETEQYKNYVPRSTNGGCQDRYQMRQIGTAKRGYPLYEKTTMFDESGKESYTMINEVVELSNTTLDAALFDVPSDYREVKDTTELYASMSQTPNNSSAVMQSNNNNNSSSNLGMRQNVKTVSNSTINVATELGAKKTGVVRIGLANVKTGAVGEGLNAQELASAIQNTFAEYVKSPSVELVGLEAKLPTAIDAEARQKECDYVIYATASHKKGSGGFGGMFGKTLSSVVSQTGIGYNTGSVAGNIAGQVATTAIASAVTVSANVKAKDELTLEVKLMKGVMPALVKQYKQKAKGDGDDIITPVVEQAAQAILDAAK
jgi:hypothetical protein